MGGRRWLCAGGGWVVALSPFSLGSRLDLDQGGDVGNRGRRGNRVSGYRVVFVSFLDGLVGSRSKKGGGRVGGDGLIDCLTDAEVETRVAAGGCADTVRCSTQGTVHEPCAKRKACLHVGGAWQSALNGDPGTKRAVSGPAPGDDSELGRPGRLGRDWDVLCRGCVPTQTRGLPECTAS